MGSVVLVTDHVGPHAHDNLSDRESQVMRMLAAGHTNKGIAGELGISVRTVETHREHVMQKLQLSTRADIVRYAMEHGLLNTDLSG